MRKLIAVILTAALLCAALLSFAPLLKNRSQDAKYADYFADPGRYDIVFLGSSHVIMGTLPMELWKDYGFSSYNLANYGQLIQADYWLLRLILSKASPKLVVVDLYSARYNDEFDSTNSDYMHGLMDCFPLSKLKYHAIKDIFPEDMQKEYLFPLYYYHSRWNKIDKESFSDPKDAYFFGQGSDESAIHGISTPVLVRSYESAGPTDNRDIDRSDTLGKEYLRKIIELCRENGIPVMGSVVPFLAYDDDMKWVNSALEIAEEYGLPVCSGLDPLVINPQTDMFDYGHLNSSGARKWTDVLGKFIADNFDLPRYESGEVYDFWENEYSGKYIPFKSDIISRQKMLYNYLMLCADKNLSVCLYIPAGSEIFSDKESADLIKNLCHGKELSLLSGTDGTEDYFLCADKISGKLYEYADRDIDCELSTGFGTAEFKGRVLSVNGTEIADWNDVSPHEMNRLQLGIAVFDNQSGKLMSTKWFYRAESGSYSSLN